MMNERLVIVPTYNEIENIDSIVDAVLNLSIQTHLLIVDDNSPDGTGKRIKELQSAHQDKLHLLERSGKLGLGTAYIMGFKWAIEKGYLYICEMDADFSHNPSHIPAMLDLSRSVDVVIGSRYVPGGGSRNCTWKRILLSRMANLVARTLLGLRAKDTTAGYRLYRRYIVSHTSILI